MVSAGAPPFQDLQPRLQGESFPERGSDLEIGAVDFRGEPSLRPCRERVGGTGLDAIGEGR